MFWMLNLTRAIALSLETVECRGAECAETVRLSATTDVSSTRSLLFIPSQLPSSGSSLLDQQSSQCSFPHLAHTPTASCPYPSTLKLSCPESVRPLRSSYSHLVSAAFYRIGAREWKRTQTWDAFVTYCSRSLRVACVFN